ncbi:DUF411 domain-containing protein [Luteimonas sp. A478]
MKNFKGWILIPAAVAALALAACAEPEPGATAADPPAAAAPAEATATATTPPADADADIPMAGWPTMTVYKTPSCGCCVVWIEHVNAAGIPVETVDVTDMGPIKQELGVPYGKGSCHTASIDGYLIEGHVPIEDIRRLLDERPRARGLVLPGMPLGSPGMEMPDGRSQAFTVELVAEDGSTTAWAHHPAR